MEEGDRNDGIQLHLSRMILIYLILFFDLNFLFMVDPFYEGTSVWINDNDENEYYSNKFLFCANCRSTIHIISLNMMDNRLITYNCNCGQKEGQLEDFLEENIYFLKKTSYVSGNFCFNNKKSKSSFTLNKIIPDCVYGRKSISLCHVCSEYLCDICLNCNKTNLIYKENLVIFIIFFALLIKL